MTKYFSKKESDVIISLLNSKDIENNKFGMNLIITHKRFKSILSTIVIRYNKNYTREYYKISPKYSFKDFLKIYNIIKNDLDTSWQASKFFEIISKFVKKRTR